MTLNDHKGKEIARGRFRTVYQYKGDSTKVIKRIVKTPDHNKREWDIWHKHKNLRPYLARPYKIEGKYMSMERGEKITKEEIPTDVPACFYKFEDCLGRAKNWVRINNKVVLCDYGEISIQRVLEKNKAR